MAEDLAAAAALVEDMEVLLAIVEALLVASVVAMGSSLAVRR